VAIDFVEAARFWGGHLVVLSSLAEILLANDLSFSDDRKRGAMK
jgi:hypothetical protein